MGNALGPVSYPRQRQPMFLGQPGGVGPDGQRAYSEATARALDRETKAILETRLAHVQQLLQEKRHVLDRISVLLLEILIC